MIVLWSDHVSLYAFVAKAWAYALEADYEIELQWRPCPLDIASYMGSVQQSDPHHWRRELDPEDVAAVTARIGLLREQLDEKGVRRHAA